MFAVSLKLIIRNIWKYKGVSIINIFGLSLGMACSILLLLWVNYHYQFDKFLDHPDRVCRVIQHIRFEDMTTWAITQGPLGPSLKEEVPEIVDYCRFMRSGLRFEKDKEQVQERGSYADPSVFDMFSVRILKRQIQQPLTEPNQIAISESMARRHFGNEDPIGRTLHAPPDMDFMVTAVFEDYPKQSHWWFDYLIPFAYLDTLGYTITRWNNSGYYTYVSLAENVSRESVVKKIEDFLKPKPTLEEYVKLDLQPVQEIHRTIGFDFEGANTIEGKYLRIFLAIGIFLIMMASINFMNLATARASGRIREIGMKKTLGGMRKNLVGQFIGEAIAISLISILMAMMLVELARPAFNNMTGAEISIDYSNPLVYLSLLGFGLIIGVLSGLYPAFYLASHKPIAALRGSELGPRTRKNFRRALVVFQFVISIVLITVTIIMSSQITYMLNKDLGYNQQGVIWFPESTGFYENFESVRDQLLRYPSVKMVSRTGNLPTRGYNFSNSRFRWDGQDLSKETLFRALLVDYDYFSTLGIEMKEGRAFSRDFASDSLAIVLNEAAVREMGIGDTMGMEVRLLTSDTTHISLHVIGVSEDYHFRSLHTDIEPQITILDPRSADLVLLRIDTDGYPGLEKAIQELWDQYEHVRPLQISFLEDSIASMYESDRAIREVIVFFTIIGLMISILGLIGLTSFTIDQKTKEIGIRKLMGARISDVVLMIATQFLKWISVSFLIAVPISYYIMFRWLNEFPYRIRLHWWLLISGGLIAILVAFATIGLQSQRAARANPADSLRYE